MHLCRMSSMVWAAAQQEMRSELVRDEWLCGFSDEPLLERISHAASSWQRAFSTSRIWAFPVQKKARWVFMIRLNEMSDSAEYTATGFKIIPWWGSLQDSSVLSKIFPRDLLDTFCNHIVQRHHQYIHETVSDKNDYFLHVPRCFSKSYTTALYQQFSIYYKMMSP